MSDSAFDERIAVHDFSVATSMTVTDPTVFRSRGLAAWAQGDWMTAQQLDIGLRGVAVALRDRTCDRKFDRKCAAGITFEAGANNTAQIAERLPPFLVVSGTSFATFALGS